MTEALLRLFLLSISVRPPLADTLYSLSYVYFALLGTLTTIVCGLVVSVITGETLFPNCFMRWPVHIGFECRIKATQASVFRLWYHLLQGGLKQENLNSDLFVSKKDIICFSWCSKSEVRLTLFYSYKLRICFVTNSLLNCFHRTQTSRKRPFIWEMRTQHSMILTWVKALRKSPNFKAIISAALSLWKDIFYFKIIVTLYIHVFMLLNNVFKLYWFPFNMQYDI